MAGRPKIVRCIQSHINAVDNTTFAGNMKTGLPPRVGVTHYYHDFYSARCNQDPNAVKKSYNNMVFLNVNPSQTATPAGFTPTANFNYTYTRPGVYYYDANLKYKKHYYRPYNHPAKISTPNDPRPVVYSRALRKLY
jgi:hypothetical protein